MDNLFKVMRNLFSSLDFRLIVSALIIFSIFIVVSGAIMYRNSMNSIKLEMLNLLREIDDAIDWTIHRKDENLVDIIAREKAEKTGSFWIMDSEGFQLFDQDPRYCGGYCTERKKFGNVVVSLYHVSPGQSGRGVFKEKLINIAQKYDEGCGVYSRYGVRRIVAFRSYTTKGIVIGVDEPIKKATSELDRLKTYIFLTSITGFILIIVFTVFATRLIIRPYYRRIETSSTMKSAHNKSL